MTLEEIIKQRLAEVQKEIVLEATKKEPVKVVKSEVEDEEEVDTSPTLKKKSMCKEDFDAMTQEEFDSIDEEQLDELSKDTLKSYINKAKKNIITLGHEKQDQRVAFRENDPKHKFSSYSDFEKVPDIAKFSKKMNDRKSGLEIAKSKLKESTVSDQVSALLEAEGLSDEFKEQAVTIFEAAVKDRVLQIQEELQEEFKSQLAEAKEELESDIDGFLSEAIQQWKSENEVAIKSNFKSQLAESFIDGMKALIAEHNIELPEGQENALEEALKEVEKLNESFSGKDQEIASLQESINELKAGKILESFKSKMTQTEFDRFSQLTESVKFKDEEQYAKQLTVVLENFGSTKKEVKKVQESVITEQVSSDIKIVTESDSTINQYAAYMSKKR